MPKTDRDIPEAPKRHTDAQQIPGIPPAAPLLGFATGMQVSLAALEHIPGGIVNQTAVFRNRWNYGHLSPPEPGTSDHLPVLLQV